MTARNRPPSRARYAATHPSKTIHFDAPTYALVEALLERSGLTANQFIRQALGSMERHIDEIQERGRVRHREEGRRLGFAAGYERGYAEAEAAFRLTYPCYVCGKPIEIRAGEEDASRAVGLLSEDRWGHEDCIDELRRENPQPYSGPRIGPMNPMYQDPATRALMRAWRPPSADAPGR
jgi:hypothetical protein